MNQQWIQDALLIVLKAAAALIVVLAAGTYFWNKYQSENQYAYENPYCNIAVIPIEGGISTVPDGWMFSVGADKVLADLRAAESDPYTEGILIRIDSPGGTPVASEMIADAIRRSQKPVAALIREIGTSGAYWIASGADTIIASPDSTVGSIGVTSSYVETAGQLKNEGKRYVELTSAPYKDVGNPDRPLSDAEKKMILKDLEISHQNFVAQVARNRSLSVDAVSAIADGSTFLGEKAKQLGLVDTLGDQETARAWFDEKIENDVDFCEPPPLLPPPPPTPSQNTQIQG